MTLLEPRIDVDSKRGTMRIRNLQASDTGHYKCTVRNNSREINSFYHRIIVYDLVTPYDRYEVDMYDSSENIRKTIIPEEDLEYIRGKINELWAKLCQNRKCKAEFAKIHGCNYVDERKMESEICYMSIDVKSTLRSSDKCKDLCLLKLQKNEMKSIATRFYHEIGVLINDDIIIRRYLVSESIRGQSFLHCDSGFHFVEPNHCIPCYPGRYCVKNENKPCPKGTYQMYFGRGDCTPCPDGKTTENEGRTDLKACFSKNVETIVKRYLQSYSNVLDFMFG
ncbi:uncharacterized protein [Centruroides vittatus]|uniref:uncharacterized protein n=1 Tax=Centruroides vittatus TaxID=120091 RepID=UPI0035105C18